MQGIHVPREPSVPLERLSTERALVIHVLADKTAPAVVHGLQGCNEHALRLERRLCARHALVVLVRADKVG